MPLMPILCDVMNAIVDSDMNKLLRLLDIVRSCSIDYWQLKWKNWCWGRISGYDGAYLMPIPILDYYNSPFWTFVIVTPRPFLLWCTDFVVLYYYWLPWEISATFSVTTYVTCFITGYLYSSTSVYLTLLFVWRYSATNSVLCFIIAYDIPRVNIVYDCCSWWPYNVVLYL